MEIMLDYTEYVESCPIHPALVIEFRFVIKVFIQ
jgi:hypothetical protein